MNEMEIAAQQQSLNGENESESCTTSATDELTESSENLFLRNISEIIANSERNSASNDGCSSVLIEEVKSIVQPQFGYFLPLSISPRMRSKRFVNKVLAQCFDFTVPTFLFGKNKIETKENIKLKL